MKSGQKISYARKFADELQAFLLEYDISIESGIVGYAMQELTGVRFKDERNNYGLNFSYYNSSEKEEVIYKIPEISFDEYYQLAAYFNIPKDKQKIASYMEVSKEVIEAKVFVELRQFINNLKTTHPDLFMSFKIASKAKLEKMASDEVIDAAYKLKKILLENDGPGMALIIQSVVAVEAAILNINNHAEMYDFLFAAAKNQFHTVYKKYVSRSNDEKEACRFLAEGMERFEKYNRCMSVVAGKNLMKNLHVEMEALNLSAKDSSVFENTLLKLAGVEKMPKKCRFNIGDDKSRLVFSFTGIDRADHQKIIAFLKEKGDVTAKEGYGSQAWNSYRPSGASEGFVLESALVRSEEVDEVEVSSSYLYGHKRKQVETLFIECDAFSFYKTVYPEIFAELRSINVSNPEMLAQYRPKADDTMKVSAQSMFSGTASNNNNNDDDVMVPDFTVIHSESSDDELALKR